MRMKIFLCTFSLFLLASLTAVAQPEPLYTKYDTLMGSNTPQRSWWDVQRYDIHVSPQKQFGAR
jgi:hypothetical protein